MVDTNYVTELYPKVLQCVKASNGVPTEEDDFWYHMKYSNGFESASSDTAKNVSDTLTTLASFASSHLLQRTVDDKKDTSDKTNNSDDSRFQVDKLSEKLMTQLASVEKAKDQEWANILYGMTDIVDGLLEKTDSQLRKHLNGEDNNSTTVVSSSGMQEAIAAAGASTETFKLATPSSSALSNDPTVPFVHRRASYSSPLTNNVVIPEESEAELAMEHPYYSDIISIKYSAAQLNNNASNEDDSYYHSRPNVEALNAAREARVVTWIDTQESLVEMAKSLSSEIELAVDLEHHSTRSYLGFTCLMQISDRSRDFLVDTIALRRHIGPVLGPIFTNSKILKVLHGADHDVQWLQRDFGIYIVNMFDTGQAARVLGYTGYSLAHLLSLHCRVKANKAYQLADWRTRPLSKEMKAYAAQDTSDLLYIYDRMKASCIAKSTDVSLLHQVLSQSNRICLTLYRKPVVPSYEKSCKSVINTSASRRRSSNNSHWSLPQLAVAHELNLWRDSVARKMDESTTYVLKNQAWVSISRAMPLTFQQLQHVVNPVPPMVKKHLVDVLKRIRSAKENVVTEVEEPKKIVEMKPAVHIRSFEEAKSTDNNDFEFPGWMSSKKYKATLKANAACSAFALEFTAVKEKCLDANRVALMQSIRDSVKNDAFFKLRPTLSCEDNLSKNAAPQMLSTLVEVQKEIKASREAAVANDVAPKSLAETYKVGSQQKKKKVEPVPKEKKTEFQAFDYSKVNAKEALNPTSGTSTTSKVDAGYNPFIIQQPRGRNSRKKSAQDRIDSQIKSQQRLQSKPRSSTFVPK